MKSLILNQNGKVFTNGIKGENGERLKKNDNFFTPKAVLSINFQTWNLQKLEKLTLVQT